MCICRTPGIGLGIGQERFGPRLQRRLTSPLRLARPARKLPTLSCTLALLPRHRLPVASSLAQPQIASSPVEVRAVARQVHQPQLQSGRPEIFPHCLATPELPEGAPGHCPRSRSIAQSASPSVVPERPPRSRSCCCPPVPSTPPLLSPSILPNSSWPSPPYRGLVESTRASSPLSTHLPRSPASARK